MVNDPILDYCNINFKMILIFRILFNRGSVLRRIKGSFNHYKFKKI
jgi:hypothetical protein